MSYSNNQYLKLDLPIYKILKINININDDNNEKIEDFEMPYEMPNIVIAYGNVNYNNIIGTVKILITDYNAIEKNDVIPEFIEYIIIYRYIYRNNENEIKRLKLEWKNGNIIDKIIHSNLKNLCEAKCFEFMKSNNFNVNYINKEGNSILHTACYFQLEKLALKLLDIPEILINQKNRNGNTALFFTYIYHNMKKTTKKIIENNELNINCIDPLFGKTILFEACKKRDKKMVDIILKTNIDLTIKDNIGLTALDEAIRFGSKTITFKIMKKIDFDEKLNGFKYNYESALVLACADLADEYRKNKMEKIILKLLKKKDLNINTTVSFFNESYNTPLIIACIKNNKKIVYELLKRPEININYVNKFGKSAITILNRSDIDYDLLLHFKKLTKIESDREEILSKLMLRTK